MKTLFKNSGILFTNASRLLSKLLDYIFTYTTNPMNYIAVGSITFDPILSNNRFLMPIVDGTGTFYMINATDGTVLATKTDSKWIYGYGSAFDPVLSNNRFMLCIAEQSRVSVVDSTSLDEIDSISGFGLYDDYVANICFDPIVLNNRLVVSRFASNKITFIDSTTLDLSTGIDVTGFNNPFSLVFNDDGSNLFVANYSGNSISVVNATSLAITGTITGFNNPRNLAFHPIDKNVLFVTNFGDNTISIVDTLSLTIIQTFAVVDNPTGLAFDVSDTTPRFFTAGFHNGNLVTGTQS